MNDVRENRLVEFDTAKFAEEKGFDWNDKYFIWVYDTDDKKLAYMSEVDYVTKHNREPILAPNQSLLQKWLRKEHEIYVQVYLADKDPRLTSKKFQMKFYIAVTYYVESMGFLTSKDWYMQKDGDDFLFDEYEDALEVGLNKGLELIQ